MLSSLFSVVYICAIWNLLLVLVGFCHGGRQMHVCGTPWRRVLCLVPAHDEEDVVQDTVLSCMRAGCDVMVICDSCTDMTWRRSAELGAFVVSVDEGNKGAALNRVLSESVLPLAYDYLAVVDCGTVVDPCFSSRIVESLQSADVVQGSMRSTGRLTLVGSWYAWLYGLQHLIQLGRSVLGLSAFVGGTGFAWRSGLPLRFDPACLVEDLELSLRWHAAGLRVAYADLGVYDEKPASWAVSLRQRVRWARGGWWLIFHGRGITWRIDDIVTVCGPFVSIVSSLLMLRCLILAPLPSLVWLGLYAVIGIAGMVCLGDAERFRPWVLISIPIMSLIEGCISFCALCTVGRHAWARTPHVAHR